MVALGVTVGHGSTPMDDWFHRHGRDARYLTLLVSPWVLASVVVATVTWLCCPAPALRAVSWLYPCAPP